jgi:hypothetical protein
MIADNRNQPEVKAEGRPGKGRKPLWILLAAGTAAIGLAWLYLHFSYGLPIGKGPAGPEVSPDAFKAPWAARPVLLAGLGDSITAGFGARCGYGDFDRLKATPDPNERGYDAVRRCFLQEMAKAAAQLPP